MAEKLTRRTFITRGGAALGTLALPAALSPAAEAARRAVGGTLAEFAAPSGTIVFGMETVPPGMDPHKWWNGAAFEGGLNIFDTLLKLDEKTGKIGPGLAAMPQISNGGKTYVFKLRRGVTFHDGSALSASDVKFSFERLLSPQLAGEASSLYTVLPIVGLDKFLAGKTKTVSGIAVMDPYTVAFHFEAPDSGFVPSITYVPASIVPAAVVQRLGTKKFNWAPVGTGPFKVASVDQQRGVKLVKNPHYWKPGLPKANAVDWQFHVDPQLSALRILRGEQDMMYEPAPAGIIDQVRANPSQSKQLVVTQLNECWWMSLSEKVPQLQKVAVRKAIAMAIDKNKLHRTLKGIGLVANGGVFSPLSPYYQKGLAWPYNPTEAKKLLASAGLGSGFTVKAWCANFFPWTDMAQSVQQDLAAVGIKMNLTPMSYDQFVNLTNGAPAGLVFFNWGLSYPHGSFIVDAAFTSAAIKAGCCNYAHWTYPGFDKLATEAHRTPSTSKSISLYKQIDRIVTREQVVWVPLIYGARPDLISTRVKGFESGTGGTDEPKELWTVSV